MKILFFFVNDVTLNIFTKIEADLLMNHTLSGDDIYIVKDFDSNIGKSQMSYPDDDHLSRHKKVFYNLISYLKKQGAQRTHLDYKETNNFVPKVFDNIETLISYNIDGYNIGMGVASTTITLLRDHKVDTIKNKKFINRELKNSLDVIATVDEYVQSINPDLIYLFNGRTSIFSPIVSYCKKYQLPFRVYETTSRYDKYHLLEDSTPHNITYRRKEINDLWNDPAISFEEKQRIGISFFKEQRAGINELDPCHIILQNKEMDKDLIRGKEVIAFFNSSIDECAAVPGWENYIYLFKDETEAIETICNHYKDDSHKIFILRIHPNLPPDKNTQNKNLQKLKQIKNLIVIDPESPIRSYSLLDISDKIITFGSTIGIESCYYGKPSISLGLSFYENLDAIYIPKDKDELFSLIDNKSLLPKPKENALPYGYWFKTFGEDFSNFTNGNISVEDYQLRPTQKAISIILKCFDLLKWKHLKLYLRIFKIFKPKNNIIKRMIKDPIYRKNFLKTFIPWE